MESGLNDGICVPLLFALLATTTGNNADNNNVTLVTTLFLQQIGIGVLVAAGFAILSIQLRQFCIQRD